MLHGKGFHNRRSPSSAPISAPVLGYPSPLATNPTTIAVSMGSDWKSGDVLKLARSSSLSMTSPTILTHTITDTDITNGTFSIGLSGVTLAGTVYFQAYGARSGQDSRSKSNIVAWGLSAAPTITSSTTQSQAELQPMAYSVTANQNIASIQIIGGTDGALVTPSGVSAIALASGGNIDYFTKSSYAFNFRTYNYGGLFTDTSGTLNATAITPTSFSFSAATNQSRSTTVTSNTATVAGVPGGVAIPYTATPATGFTLYVNGVAAANSGNMFLGDTFYFSGTSSASYSTTLSSSMDLHHVTASYDVTTMADPSAVVARYAGGETLAFGYGAGPLSTSAYATTAGRKLVVFLAIEYNTATAVTVTAVDQSAANVPLTLIGSTDGTQQRRIYAYYTDAAGVTSITTTVAPNNSTAIADVMVIELTNAVTGAPLNTYITSTAVAITNPDPITVDGGLGITTAGNLVLNALVSGNGAYTTTYSGGTKLGQIDDGTKIRISTAYKNAAGNLQVNGQPSGGVGYDNLYYIDLEFAH